MPDVAFVSKDLQPRASTESWPDKLSLAVEVILPGNSPSEISTKVYYGTQNGVVVWLVDPDAQIITVYTADGNATKYGIDATLAGEPVLPGFKLPLKRVFAGQQ